MTFFPLKCKRKNKSCICSLSTFSIHKQEFFLFIFFIINGRFRRWETNEIKNIFKDIISIYWFWSLVETNEITMRGLSSPSKN